MSIEWNSRSLDRLADFYVAEPTSEQRKWIANHVLTINARLAEDPMFLGESRGGMHRVWFCYPLVVGYTLIPGGDIVVFHVKRLKDNLQNPS